MSLHYQIPCLSLFQQYLNKFSEIELCYATFKRRSLITLVLEVVHITCFLLQIKLSSVQLARKYMGRVASELDALSGPEKEPNREFLLLQGVRFAFRVHQVYIIGEIIT